MPASPGNRQALGSRSRSIYRVPVLVATGMALVVVVVAVVGFAAHGSALETLAEGTWSCTAQGDEDQDVYGDANHEPFDVIVGDGTFSMPSRSMSGTWTFDDGALHIDSVWSKSTSEPRTSTDITGLPDTSQTSGSGSAAMAARLLDSPASPLNRSLDWSYTGGQLTVSGGGGIADTGVVCEKESETSP